MLSLRLRSITFAVFAFAGATGFAARGVLRADGLLRLKGVDPRTTSIMVVPEGSPSYSLPSGTKDFELQLPLDDIYLISFSGHDCPFKVIYFDARVPVESHAAVFDFPFMVTLERVAPEHMFVYAGPVGFVRYLHSIKDFGYETQYAVQVDHDLQLRMDAIRATGVDPKSFLQMLPARVVNLPRGEYNTSSISFIDASPGTIAPIASEVAPMVHIVITAASIVAADLDAAERTRITSAASEASGPSAWLASSEDARIETHEEVLRSISVAVLPEARITNSLEENEALVRPPESRAVVAWTSLRTDELITGARMITRIVRFSTPSDGVIEFRKVTHAFGAVYYFQGNRSITERAFFEATAPEVAGAL